MPQFAPAKKSLAQNFLTDRRIVSRIIAAADIAPDDNVLEIGPGRGILTRPLADRTASLTAVELDDDLAAELTTEFAEHSHVNIVHADARHVDISSLLADVARYKLIANLPYYAAQPIIRRFLEAKRQPTMMVVMVQREVARNMTAAPGGMTLLSVATQLYGKPRIVGSVPPRAFRPAPKVTSAIVRIDVYSRLALDLDSADAFFTLVRAGFSAPRKQIHNCLQNGLTQNGLTITRVDAEDVLQHANIDPKRRPQTLSLDEWGDLYAAWRLRYPESDAHTQGIREN
ncbi:MAG: 16S rRNA (adenine(1518)-N(6)/adenine(1519)-N(6))-dimethyltransferase RsmA [Chloroflexota bacterium]|nr:16S rRNA (adenine(1518)-N(6)/adenine(1519)-N(6))-dimethyltransferase RsmA [Chloroflexota bacterium]